jgi:tRNA nucleotidyltransferase/poly(A) polymerase
VKISKRHLQKIIKEAVDGMPTRVDHDIPIPKDLEDIHKSIKYAGRELYLVGGAVRDTLLGQSPKDYDVATNASPEEIIKILQKNSQLKLDLTGKQFGVVRVKTPEGGEYEIATFREDIGKGKATKVKFSTIEADVKRRDLTVNALFYDMDSKEIVDYVGGIEDIEDSVIRAVGDPAERFDEDRIRILRAVRFAGRMGSGLDPATKKAILEDNELIDVDTGQPIPADRITEEFIKGIKSAADVNHFLSLIQELGLFEQILPGLEIQISNSGSQDYIAQVAALLADNPADLVVPTLKRLRYSNDEVKTIKFLLQMIELNRDTAAELKKSFNRLNISAEHVHNFSELVGMPSEAKVRGFLEFADAPPAGDPKELIAQGLQGPEIGLAMAQAESDSYTDFIGEIRKYIRQILVEKKYIPEEEDVVHGLSFSEMRQHLSMHFGKAKITITQSPLDLERSYAPSTKIKPTGIWYGCGVGWLKFVEENDWESTAGSQIWSLKINMGKIKSLVDAKEIDRFSWKFRNMESYIENHLDKRIDWAKVASTFSGIECCPYPVGDKTKIDNLWYYAFDMASGCIWDASAISNTILVAELKEDGWEMYV